MITRILVLPILAEKNCRHSQKSRPRTRGPETQNSGTETWSPGTQKPVAPEPRTGRPEFGICDCEIQNPVNWTCDTLIPSILRQATAPATNCINFNPIYHEGRGAHCTRGRIFCLLWEHQTSWESEIFREFLKLKERIFGLKKSFSKILYLLGSGPFVRTFSKIWKMVL